MKNFSTLLYKFCEETGINLNGNAWKTLIEIGRRLDDVEGQTDANARAIGLNDCDDMQQDIDNLRADVDDLLEKEAK